MIDNTFNLLNLIPDFPLLLNGEYTSPHGMSALIVAVLIAIAIIFFIVSLWKYFVSSGHINFYHRLLNGLATDNLLAERRELLNKALSSKKFGKLWQEFDESLVTSPDGKRLFNTIDAAHFFNTHTLSHGLIDNRMLAAVPGFLTAIGVLGTFAGLQMGLGSLELSKDAGVETLRNGIGNMISGASIAFLTSVWGVFTSLVFNFIEKGLERNVRMKVFSLQNRIDNLYPRVTPEEALINIEDYSKNSKEILSGLAEKIGDRMQETLHEVTNQMQNSLQTSLEKILAPALSDLAANAKNSSEQALKTLVDDFMAGVKQAGAEQSTEMKEAADKLTASVDSMNDVIEGFSNKLADQQKSTDGKFHEILNRFGNMMEDLHVKTERQQGALIDNMQQQLEKTVEKLNGIAMTMGAETSSLLENVTSKATARFEELRSIDVELRDSVRQLVEFQKAINSELSSQFKDLYRQFSEIGKANTALAENISTGAENMQKASASLTIVSSNMKSSAESMGQDLKAITHKTEELLEIVTRLASELNGDMATFTEISSEISRTIETLRQAAEHAENGFTALDDQQERLMESLKDHVVELENKLAELLDAYAQKVQAQTQERLNEWNRQTNEYTATMTDAVQTLASVVDEIETKISR